MRRWQFRAPAPGGRLDDVLGAGLPGLLGHPVSRSAVRRLVMSGAVSVEGRRCPRPGLVLAAGARVDALVDVARLAPASPPQQDLVILYEDAWLVAVDKPPGLPTHATADPDRLDLVSEVRRALERRDRRAITLHLHQRLDIGTSGVVLLARDPAADRGLARAFEGRQVEKTYLALTARPARLPAPRFEIDAPLGRGDGPGQRGGRTFVGQGQPALTEVALREVLAGALLVEARPRTGRRHQIRAHLASVGLPLLGDALYAPAPWASAAPRPMLHAAALRLGHPVTGAVLSIEAPIPADLQRAIDAARKGRRNLARSSPETW